MVLPEAALLLRKKTLRLEGPHEASINHPLHRLTQTAGSCYGSKITGIRVVLTGFRNGNEYRFAPRWQKTVRFPDVVIYF